VVLVVVRYSSAHLISVPQKVPCVTADESLRSSSSHRIENQGFFAFDGF